VAKEISIGLKWTFFIHFLIFSFFSVLNIFLVELYLELIGWPYLDPVTLKLFGAAYAAFAISSYMGWKETEWTRVKIIVVMEIAWGMYGTAQMFWSLYMGLYLPLYPPLPPMGWVYLIIFIVFLIAFIVFYIQHEKEKMDAS